MTLKLEKKKLLGFRIENNASPEIGSEPIIATSMKLGLKPQPGSAIGAKFGTKVG